MTKEQVDALVEFVRSVAAAEAAAAVDEEPGSYLRKAERNAEAELRRLLIGRPDRNSVLTT